MSARDLIRDCIADAHRMGEPALLFGSTALGLFADLQAREPDAFSAEIAKLPAGHARELVRRLRATDSAGVSADGPIELDLTALGAREPEPPAFIVPDWLPAGEVTLLAAHGGTGKSSIGLHLGACITLARAWHGLPVKRRGVDFVSFEDRADVLHWRLHRVAQALGVTLADLQAAGLRVFDATACAAPWFSRLFGEAGPTASFHEVADRIGGPGRVVVVDGSSDVFAGDENNRAEVKAFIRTLRRLIADDGALLLLAHVDKQAVQKPADSPGFSGSTGWHNGVRCRWFMYLEDEGGETGDLVLEVRKSNLGPAGGRMVLRFDEGAHVFARVDSGAVAGRPFQRVDEVDAILDAIRKAWASGNPVPAAMSGQRTAYSVAEANGDFPASLKGRPGRGRFARHLEQLRAAGAVIVESHRRPNRHMMEVFRARD